MTQQENITQQGTAVQPDTLTLHVADMSGQREYVARNVSKDASWGETMGSILANMALPKNTPAGPSAWSAHLERESRHLHASEIVGDALVDGDKVVLQPEVNAG